MEARIVLSPILGPLQIDGTAAGDTIVISEVPGSRTDVLVSVNGQQSGPYRPIGPIQVRGLAGDDTITVAAGVSLPTQLEGNAGTDVLNGGSGDDAFLVRDGESDRVSGGQGRNSAFTDSHDIIAGIEILNPGEQTPGNSRQTVRVLVINYEPQIPSEGGRKLWEVFGWNDPRNLAKSFADDIERVSGDSIDIEITQWKDLNKFPAFEDGYRYQPDEYVQNRRTSSGWHPGNIDFPAIVAEEGIASVIDSGVADEVWFYGDHYFIPVIGESWMAGPGAFFINGPVFPDIPVSRAFACMGFNYERGADLQLHNLGHRTESTMNRIYGGWNLASPKTNWDRFSANDVQSNGLAGVGTTHFPANAVEDYDTDNPRVVESWADDFLNYPNLSGTREPVSRSTWSKGQSTDYEYDYQKWYFSHLPRAAGVNSDGRQNNWWKYIYDFNNYTEEGANRAGSAILSAPALLHMGGTEYLFDVAYSSANAVRLSSLGSGDVVVSGPGNFLQPARFVSASDSRDDTRIVATYRITAPGGQWDALDAGVYRVQLQANEVLDSAGNALSSGPLGSFFVGTEAAVSLPVDSTSSLMLQFNGNARGVTGESPLMSSGLTWTSGWAGRAVQIGDTSQLQFSKNGNIVPSQGTVEFWIRPAWNSAPDIDHRFFEVGTEFDNGMILGIDGAQNLRFIRWGDDPTTGTVERDVERGVAASGASWTANTWHHFAATWNDLTGEMSLYVDGALADTRNNGIRIPAFSGTNLAVGGKLSGGSSANAAFDEFRISNRALSSDEIREDFLMGLYSFSSLSISIQSGSSSLTSGSSKILRASAVDSSGQSVDVSRSVQWSSSAPAVVSVDRYGLAAGGASGTAVITAQLGTLTANMNLTVVSSGGPVPSFSIGDITTFGTGARTIAVTYTDPNSTLSRTLGLGDLVVTGPNGFFQFPVYTGQSTSQGITVANYALTPPGGHWDVSDNGVYQATVLSGQVEDSLGNPSGGNVSHKFQVGISPTILGPQTPVASAAPTIIWEQIPYAVSYELWVNNLTTNQNRVIGITTPLNSAKGPVDLGIGLYRAWVRSVHANGFQSPWSQPFDFRTTTAVTVNPVARQQNTSRPVLSWPALSGASRYDLWIDNLSTGTSQFVRQTGLTSTSWTSLTDLPLGRFRAWVRGIDAKGVGAGWSAAVDFDVVPSPSALTPTSATFSRRPVFSWNSLPGAARYDVYVRNLSNGQLVYYPRNLTTTNWTPPANLSDGPYRWWVQARSDQNVYSLWSAPADLYIGGRTTLTAPVGSVTDSTPTFLWNAVDGARQYELWVEFTTTQTRVVHELALTVTSFTQVSALAKGSYRVWVRAISSTGEKAVWSAPWNFSIAGLDRSPANSGPMQPLTSDADLPAVLQASLLATDHRSSDSAFPGQTRPENAVIVVTGPASTDNRDTPEDTIDACGTTFHRPPAHNTACGLRTQSSANPSFQPVVPAFDEAVLIDLILSSETFAV